VTPAPPPPDPDAPLTEPVQLVLGRFVAWASTHAGAACPGAAELGAPVLDPWGTPLAITCTDQPANQIVGVISAGPDRVAGTADDIGSWQLPREVTDRVRGVRWKAAAPPRTVPAKSRPGQRPRRDDFDDIPAQR
jgi:hypothetical protein